MNQHSLVKTVTQDGREGSYCIKCWKDDLSTLYNALNDPCAVSDEDYAAKIKKRDARRWGKR